MPVEAAMARQILDDADLLITPNEVNRAVERVAAEISSCAKQEIPVFICVMNGGLIFAGKLLPLLDFPLELDYIHATRYGDSTSGRRIEWKSFPHADLKNRQVILVDDILDEGITIDAISAYCIEQGAREVLLAVLLEKQHTRKIRPGIKADFTGLVVEDRFVFGCGLDYKGLWRNAPGIYAVKGS